LETPLTRASPAASDSQTAALDALLAGRPIVLVGMMGAGKTTVGRRLAQRLGRRFVDSDEEIETAAGMSIEDLFRVHGEPEFRAGEARVLSRLLSQHDIVLGTGGGAFINADTRAEISRRGVSVWLKAELALLFARVSRRSNRPLLKTANPRETLKTLMDVRYPIYAEADVTVLSRDVPQEQVAADIVAALLDHLAPAGAPHAQQDIVSAAVAEPAQAETRHAEEPAHGG
jgi:shikimate kinase